MLTLETKIIKNYFLVFYRKYILKPKYNTANGTALCINTISNFLRKVLTETYFGIWSVIWQNLGDPTGREDLCCLNKADVSLTEYHDFAPVTQLVSPSSFSFLHLQVPPPGWPVNFHFIVEVERKIPRDCHDTKYPVESCSF